MKKPKKIMFLIPNFSGGGAETVMVSLFNSISSNFHKEFVVLNANGPLREKIQKLATLHDLNRSSAIAAVPSLVSLFRRQRPEIVFSTMAYFNFVVVFSLLLSMHRPDRLILREANVPSSTAAALPFPFLTHFLYRYLYSFADVVVCNSEQVKKELFSFGLLQKLIEVLPNPIDVSLVRKLAKSVNLPSVDLVSSHPVFVSVGRLTKQKGMDKVISCFANAKTDGRLIIVGDGPEKENLQRIIVKHDLAERIFLFPYMLNPFPLIARSDAVLFGSNWEGLPNVSLEAMALGKIIVATDRCGGLVELSKKERHQNLKIVKNLSEFTEVIELIANSKTKNSGLQKNWLPSQYSKLSAVRSYERALFGSQYK